MRTHFTALSISGYKIQCIDSALKKGPPPSFLFLSKFEMYFLILSE
uniref:Uncharacterized protein n=1 Tax=Anguilla anguilla TaxID=7936 RepID=A0A0E9VTS2_ANGAN